LPLRLINSGKTEHRYAILQLSRQQEFMIELDCSLIENKYRLNQNSLKFQLVICMECFGLRVIHGCIIRLQFSIMVICFVDEYSAQKVVFSLFSRTSFEFYNQ
jgi:hypothetical protein